jgi:transposase
MRAHFVPKPRETRRHVQAFEAWLRAGRRCPKVAARFGISERSLRRWIVQWDWHARADDRDHEAAVRAEQRGIRERVRQLQAEQQAEAARQEEARRQLEAKRQAEAERRPADAGRTLPLSVLAGGAARREWIGGNHNAHAQRHQSQVILDVARSIRGSRRY